MLATDERTCEQCGEVLVRRKGESPSSFSGRRFCSHDCFNEARRAGRPRVQCEECGGYLPSQRKRHCSAACRNKSAEKAVTKKSCEECGQTFAKKPEDSRRTFEGRRFCSASCSGRYGQKASQEKNRAHREHVIGEVEFLVGTDSMESLSRRLGYKPNSLAHMLDDWGRSDLAQRLRATSFDMARPCPDCTRLIKPSLLEEHRATTCRGVG